MRTQRREIHIVPEAEFERGKLVAGERGFHTLVINADPLYEYSNWTTTDLKDLRDALNWFIEHVDDQPKILTVEKP